LVNHPPWNPQSIALDIIKIDALKRSFWPSRSFWAATMVVCPSAIVTSGTWTHDYPITCERARALGLPVNSDMPENILHLMQLYPQPMRRQPSVEYVPLPYRSNRGLAPEQ
jgi:hypothetical protein